MKLLIPEKPELINNEILCPKCKGKSIFPKSEICLYCGCEGKIDWIDKIVNMKIFDEFECKLNRISNIYYNSIKNYIDSNGTIKEKKDIFKFNFYTSEVLDSYCYPFIKSRLYKGNLYIKNILNDLIYEDILFDNFCLVVFKSIWCPHEINIDFYDIKYRFIILKNLI